jgi:hypothetical protein
MLETQNLVHPCQLVTKLLITEIQGNAILEFWIKVRRTVEKAKRVLECTRGVDLSSPRSRLKTLIPRRCGKDPFKLKTTTFCRRPPSDRTRDDRSREDGKKRRRVRKDEVLVQRCAQRHDRSEPRCDGVAPSPRAPSPFHVELRAWNCAGRFLRARSTVLWLRVEPGDVHFAAGMSRWEGSLVASGIWKRNSAIPCTSSVDGLTERW